MRVTLVQIKVVHTAIFWLLSACVLYTLFSGVADRITPWTWVAVGLILLEGVVLVSSGWIGPRVAVAPTRPTQRL